MLVKIAPSILAADFASLGDVVRQTEAAGADAIHLDVMDGHFVPEISFGRQMVAAIRRHTSLPLDVHLMVVDPERHVAGFLRAGATAITVHLEAAEHTSLRRTLETTRQHGAAAGVALKPRTPAEAIDPLWSVLDQVLVMTVEPGYSGQAFMPAMLPKVETLAARAAARAQAGTEAGNDGGRIVIAVDGGIDERTAPRCVDAGATLLVAGSAVYSDRRSIAEGIRMLRAATTG